jgi:hypothetical protein
VVYTDTNANPCVHARTALAYQNVTVTDGLSTEEFYAEAL